MQERTDTGLPPRKLMELGFAAAPDDLTLLEFALKWRINPRELREQWELRDILWLELLEQAQLLAAPEIEKRRRERLVKNK